MQRINITSNTTLAKRNNNIRQAISSKYYLVIGFEVNREDIAFKNNTQDLTVDYGHAFFFTVKNGKVETFFSFGPAGEATPNKLEAGIGIDTYNGQRPGTTKYAITEITSLYKFRISKQQFDEIITLSNEFTEKVENGEEKYTAYMNDTCAETAKDILDEAGVKTPSGKGYVKTPSDGVNAITQRKDILPSFEIANIETPSINYNGVMFVNPYSWFDQFRTKYGPPIIYKPDNILVQTDGITLEKPWKLNKGDSIPKTLLEKASHGVLYS